MRDEVRATCEAVGGQVGEVLHFGTIRVDPRQIVGTLSLTRT